MNAQNNITEKTSNELASERTDMAVYRTIAAYDRTLMAWVRTCISLISFGFSIYKFFQAFVEKGVQPTFGLLGPRELGIIMLALGFTSLFFATVQNHFDIKRLKKMYPQIRIPFSTSKILSIFISVLALFLLILAVFKQ